MTSRQNNPEPEFDEFPSNRVVRWRAELWNPCHVVHCLGPAAVCFAVELTFLAFKKWVVPDRLPHCYRMLPFPSVQAVCQMFVI